MDFSHFEYSPRPEIDSSLFFSFEGIEGAGKSTQIQLFKEALEKKGWKVSIFREPGGTLIGERLRKSILASEKKLSALTETFIFLASRAELIKQEISPRLEGVKNIVILDRYIDSTLSYQGMGRKLGLETILKLHSLPPLNLLPHKTFFLSIDEETSLERQKLRGDAKDYFEREKEDFYRDIKEGFIKIAKSCPERVVSIDASRGVQEVHKSIINSWESFYGA